MPLREVSFWIKLKRFQDWWPFIVGANCEWNMCTRSELRLASKGRDGTRPNYGPNHVSGKFSAVHTVGRLSSITIKRGNAGFISPVSTSALATFGSGAAEDEHRHTNGDESTVFATAPEPEDQQAAPAEELKEVKEVFHDGMSPGGFFSMM